MGSMDNGGPEIRKFIRLSYPADASPPCKARTHQSEPPTIFEALLSEVLRLKQEQGKQLESAARDVGRLYENSVIGEWVCSALRDHFFPISLYVKHHCNGTTLRVRRASQDLALLSEMHLRIRNDISHYFDNRKATTINLDGDAFQKVASTEWCSLCGECCQLNGTVPDPPQGVHYPGYWYAYIAGDSPLLQRFCPFLFELPPQGLFFCSIHNLKPRTCLAYGRKECQTTHPGKAFEQPSS